MCSRAPGSTALVRPPLGGEVAEGAFQLLSKDQLRRVLGNRSRRVERAEAAAVAPFAVDYVAQRMVNDDVYAELGIAPGGDTARANPRHQARIVADLAKLTDFLTGLGVIDVINRAAWVERGLAA